MDSIRYVLIVKNVCDELTATIGLITCREATAECHDVTLCNVLGHLLDRLQDISTCEVLEYRDYNLCTCALECTSSVVVAVCTWEYGEVNANLINLLALVLLNEALTIAYACGRACLTLICIDLSVALGICLQELLERKTRAIYEDSLLLRCLTDELSSWVVECAAALNND